MVIRNKNNTLMNIILRKAVVTKVSRMLRHWISPWIKKKRCYIIIIRLYECSVSFFHLKRLIVNSTETFIEWTQILRKRRYIPWIKWGRNHKGISRISQAEHDLLVGSCCSSTHQYTVWIKSDPTSSHFWHPVCNSLKNQNKNCIFFWVLDTKWSKCWNFFSILIVVSPCRLW